MVPGMAPKPAAPMLAQPKKPQHMLVLGTGFVGRYVSERLLSEGWRVSGTCTSASKKMELELLGMTASIFDATTSKVCAARRPGKWTRRRRRYGLLRLLSPSCSGVGCCQGPRSDVAEEDDRPSATEDELGGRSKHDPSEWMSTEACATARAFATGGGGCRRPSDSETGRGGASDRRGPNGARRGSYRSSRGHGDSEHGAR